MASARIRLEIHPETRRRTIVIAYESDSDALPHEHEEQHRALVAKLFEGGLAREGDDIVVERERERQPEEPREVAGDLAEGVKQGS